jgi:hypothetical protein
LDRPDHLVGLWSFGNVKRDQVGGFQQNVDRKHGSGVAKRQLGLDVVNLGALAKVCAGNWVAERIPTM